MSFVPDVKGWFADAMGSPALIEAPFDAEIALKASLLPGELHGDPADRLLAATARKLNLTLVTRDRALRAYADQGHLSVLPC